MADTDFNWPEPEPRPDNVLQTPTFGQIGWLKRNIERLDGGVLDAICRPSGIAYPSVESPRSMMVNSCGCGNDTLVTLPYDKPDGRHSRVQFCLVCDGAAAWPRLESEEATAPATDPPPFDGSEHPVPEN